MPTQNKIPVEVKNALDKVAQTYADSPHTTKVGWFLRLIARIIPPSTAIKIIVAKNTRK